MSLAKTCFHLSFAQKLQQLFSGKNKTMEIMRWAWKHAFVFFGPKISKQQYKNNSSSCIVLKYA
jgi:hypothetical protein